MSKVMFKVIALGFQRIVIFVFDFPARSSNLGKMSNRCSADGVVGYKAVLIEDFAIIFMRDDQFQPIDL